MSATTKLKNWLRPFLSARMLRFSHQLRGVYAAVRYRFPARGMLVIGVTGTKGKTTSCFYLASILEEAGFKVGLASTVEFRIGERVEVNNTNKSVLPPLQMQKLIREMKQARCDAVVIEVTSIGLDQFRLWGIPFRYAGLTNITHDHLDYHQTWTRYQLAKLQLFQMKSLKAVAVNANDQSAELFLQKSKAPHKWSYGLDSAETPGATDNLIAEKISTNAGGSSFMLKSESEQARVILQLPGRFNIENALCAAALCLNLNLKMGTIVAGLEKLQRVPGRLEKIETKKGFSVLVDYAHTPDSLEKLYSTMRTAVRGRLIAVLGATGDRDRTKRPIMGALAARFCDYVFVTDEEPYTEEPLHIIEEIAKGVPRGRALFTGKTQKERPILKKSSESGEGEWWWKIADRRDAISRAIDLAKMDDLVLVTGMGSQNFKMVSDQKIAWNDQKVIEEILTEKGLQK